jgi:transcription elongation factor GreB
MSRAFVKEDAADGVVYIPPRAPLPEGAVNLVTRRGLRLLREELVQLETEREQLKRGDKENQDITRALTIVRGKIKDLESRIVGAKLVNLASQPQNEVRFGATVTIRTAAGGTPGLERKFTIVGVDEADITTLRVGFVAPISRALIGLGIGETAKLMMGGSEETLEVRRIDYSDDERNDD